MSDREADAFKKRADAILNRLQIAMRLADMEFVALCAEFGIDTDDQKHHGLQSYRQRLDGERWPAVERRHDY